MDDITIREYRMGDDREIIPLWNLSLPFDPIREETFANKVLLDPNFDPSGCRIACHGERIVGFVLAIVRRSSWWDYPIDKDRGWITAIAVHPDYGRQKIGSNLMREALDFLIEKKRKEVIFATYSPGFFNPGLDDKAYPGSLAFFESTGFEIEKKKFGMGIELYELKWPAAALQARVELAKGGIEIFNLSLEWIFPTTLFFRHVFPKWYYFYWTKMIRQDDFSEMVIAVKGQEVIGYCQQYLGDRIGPFGVKSDYRGRGIGTVMLYTLLDNMRRKNFRFGWFSGAEVGAENYYLRAGFHITRENLIMKMDLT